MRRARLDGLHAAAIAAVVSLLVYFPWYLIFIGNRLLEVRLTELVFQGFYQGVVAAALSLALFGRSIMLLGASKAAAFVALAPGMAALMAIPALGEWPTSIDWLAIGMIAAGVYLASGAPVPGLSAKPRQQNIEQRSELAADFTVFGSRAYPLDWRLDVASARGKENGCARLPLR
jgi:drug/metabolite transporter (DMT)-like permease